MALLTAMAAAGPAAAQKWTVETGVEARAEASSNADLGSISSGSDLIINLRPHVSVRADGGRLKLSGQAALAATTYADKSRVDRIVPSADVNARLEAVERLLFLDAGYRVAQTSADPFGARSNKAEGWTANANTITTSEMRFSPSVEFRTASELHVALRSENSRTHSFGATDQTAAPVADGSFGRHSALIEQPARPLGWRISAERSHTRYRDSAQADLNFDVARAGASYLVAEDLTVGMHALRERNEVQSSDENRAHVGFDATWRPTPRTNLTVMKEQRFFGSSWDVAFSHRQPRVAVEISLTKGITTSPQSLFELPASANVAALVDSMLTTRYPDPAERARAVQDLMLSRGLPASTLQPILLSSERVSVATARRGTLTLLGQRSSLALTGYVAQTQDLPGVSLADTGTALANSKQFGAGAVVTHRMTPVMNVKSGLDWSRIRTAGSVASERATERSFYVQVDLRASPKTNAYVGGLVRSLDSTTVTPGRESRIFLGMDHRF